jgi:Glycosyl hydrolase family 1
MSWLWPGQAPIPAVTTYHTRRMSISWSRLIPRGRRGSPVNEEAVTFYNNVINELKRNGIEPAITLYHWDMPQVCAENGYCHVHLTLLSVCYHCLQHPPGVAAQRLCAAWTWVRHSVLRYAAAVCDTAPLPAACLLPARYCKMRTRVSLGTRSWRTSVTLQTLHSAGMTRYTGAHGHALAQQHPRAQGYWAAALM